MIDTHAHIYMGYDDDLAAVIGRAEEVGVDRILCPAVDSQSHEAMLAVCREYEGVCYPMMGVHPTSLNDNPLWRKELEVFDNYLASNNTFVAIGEAGIDLHWSKEFLTEQQAGFEHQIEAALKYDLPLVVHSREAWAATIEVLDGYRGRGLRGVFHAYSGSTETYEIIKKLGDFVFGIGGVVTFKNSHLQEVVTRMPLSDIVLETDAPWLSPTPYRGERNEPARIPLICNHIAMLKGIKPDEVAESTTRTAERVFHLSK